MGFNGVGKGQVAVRFLQQHPLPCVQQPLPERNWDWQALRSPASPLLSVPLVSSLDLDGRDLGEPCPFSSKGFSIHAPVSVLQGETPQQYHGQHILNGGST